MEKFYICKNGIKIEFIFKSLWAAKIKCQDWHGDCVVDANTGEVVFERG